MCNNILLNLTYKGDFSCFNAICSVHKFLTENKTIYNDDVKVAYIFQSLPSVVRV